jgi:uncharacterized protein YecT (DUF1311 family)
MTANAIKRNTWIAVTMFLASASAGSAQHMNAKDAPCRTAGSGSDETRCFIKEAQRADNELNTLYNKIRPVLSPVDHNKLQSAQRLWIQFRDANCEAERELHDGGSAAPMVYQACMGADTRQRSAELDVMYGWRLEK